MVVNWQLRDCWCRCTSCPGIRVMSDTETLRLRDSDADHVFMFVFVTKVKKNIYDARVAIWRAVWILLHCVYVVFWSILIDVHYYIVFWSNIRTSTVGMTFPCPWLFLICELKDRVKFFLQPLILHQDNVSRPIRLLFFFINVLNWIGNKHTNNVNIENCENCGCERNINLLNLFGSSPSFIHRTLRTNSFYQNRTF